MGRRNQHSKAEQLQMSIAAAERVLAADGMAGFSMRKVAQEIGYTVGQLYLLFRNQDALFLCLNERTAKDIHAELVQAIAQAAEPAEAIRAAARTYIRYSLQQPHRWQLLYEHRLPAEAPVPEANAQVVRDLFQLIEESLHALMPSARASDLRLQATALWSGVHGIAVLVHAGKLGWSEIEDYGVLSDCLLNNFLGMTEPNQLVVGSGSD